MGTRADFYIGIGKDAKWLGSVAWDGYQWHEEPTCPLMVATNEEEFRAAVIEIGLCRNDWTSPENGWPWPWNDSKLTDYVYSFHGGCAHAYSNNTSEQTWPDMSKRKNVTLGRRSGLVVISRPKGGERS